MRAMILSDDARTGGQLAESIRECRLPVAVVTVFRVKDAPKAVLDHLPDLLLLNCSSWGGQGYEAVRTIRRISYVPLVAVSSSDDEEEAIRVLDHGADAYVCLSSAPSLLIARARALLRRASGGPMVADTEIKVGEVVVQSETRTVQVKGAHVKLTPSEYRLLRCLVRHAGQLVPIETLQSLIWPAGQPATGGQIKVFVSRLRAKIDPELGSQLIVTERGKGYRLALPDRQIND